MEIGQNSDNLHKCIIMSAGDFDPVHMTIDRQPGDYLIAADNGLSYLDQLGEVPDFIIGDYDSLAREEESRLALYETEHPEAVRTLPVEKDDTDTMAAARLGLQKGFRHFLLYGALGGKRLDHTLANLQTLRFLKDHGGDGCIVDQHCRLFLLQKETWKAPENFTGGFSVFAMDERLQGVTIRGMKYNAENLTITNGFPIGVSNHIVAGQGAGITVKEGTALVYLSASS